LPKNIGATAPKAISFDGFFHRVLRIIIFTGC